MNAFKFKWIYLSLVVFIIGCNNDKEIQIIEVKEQIHEAYVSYLNGTLVSGDSVPIYNIDFGFRLSLANGIAGKSFNKNFSIEPQNIDILKINDRKAIVKYDLFIKNDSEEKIEQIEMIIKNIGGIWKLDANSFFPKNSKVK